jgi:4-hydroxybenzoyl-CoA thioesterase
VITFERPIKFEDVDAAGIVFFARFVSYAHEAMEHFFSSLDGGYPRLIMERRVGLPAVHLDVSFRAPARYGEVLRIETSVSKLGNRSAVLHYRMFDARRGHLCAEISHTVVLSDLRTISSIDMPADVRARLAEHLEQPDATP